MNFFLTLHNYSDVALLILRLGLAVIFLVHGTQKFKMWAMKPSEQMPASMLGIMKLLSVCETLGGLAMLFGFLTQLAALGLAIIMVGAAHFKKSKWGKKFTGDGGWEYDFSIFILAVGLIILGAGAFSLDRILLGL